MRTIWVLRRRVDLVDQVGSILVGSHVCLELDILVLRFVEVPSEREARMGEQSGFERLRTSKFYQVLEHIDYYKNN